MSRKFLAVPQRIKVWLRNPDWNNPAKCATVTNCTKGLYVGNPCAEAYFYAKHIDTDGTNVVYVACKSSYTNAWKKITGMRAVTAPVELGAVGNSLPCDFNCHTDPGVDISISSLGEFATVKIAKSSPVFQKH